MTEKCEECGSNDMEMDNSRGELECKECGLVAEHQVSTNQNDNASAIWGENSFNTPTTRITKIKTGNKGNGLGSYIGTQKEARGKWKVLRNLGARDAKDCHPMVQATMDAAVRLSGTENAMKAKEAITRATLPIEDEVVLAEMKKAADGEEVILPKNSVCRMKTRGADTHHNEKLLALGCLRVYQGRWGGMSIDWTAMLKGTGITMKQVIDASKIIDKYFSICDKVEIDGKKLITSPKDRKEIMLANRAEEIRIMKQRLRNVVRDLDKEVQDVLMEDLNQRLFKLGEPTISESPVPNVPARILCSMLFQMACMKVGVADNRLTAIASAADKTRNAIKSRLAKLLRTIDSGEVYDNGAFDL
jgi:transcription initiation factor TFIIIB Brf1 subunit/transcription initiation factor TFIIB